ncbi:MAG: manganese transporter [Caldilinea sp. CFX5]|nr:manganese transporter [Caldilinea sp. CFX5]
MRSKLILLVLILLLVTGCSDGEPTAAAASDGLHIVTTTSMITDITKVVGGDQVAVTGLMGAGIDPHLYVASEGDMELLQNADVIFYNGLFLEAQMAEILEQIGERKTVVPVTKGIDPQQLLPWANYADEYDPHVWFDVTLWMKAVETVRDTLATVDAANAATYQANAAAYLAELTKLDAYVKEQAARVPADQRIVITAHDAFHYFGRAYGFEVRGLQGISTASEAGTADVQALADFIAEKQIKAIFVESSVPVRNIEALQAAVQDRGFTVGIGGQLFSDAMGDPGTPEGTYVGMVRHNIDTIVGALLGE